MKKVIVLYGTPTDEEEFYRYYTEVHLPLANKVPGIQEVSLTRIEKTLVGRPGNFFLVELIFPDEATFQAALKTPEFAETGHDTENFATGGVTVMIGQPFEI